MTENRRALALNTLFGFVIAAAVVAIEYSYGYTVLRLLSDGFFVSTVMLLGMGGLAAARNAGNICIFTKTYSRNCVSGTVQCCMA